MSLLFFNFLFYVFLASSAIQIAYWLFVFSKLAYFKPQTGAKSAKLPPVSVIICARNEAENLSKNLPKILAQEYKYTYEIIVVNDASTDETPSVLGAFLSENAHLRVINVAEKTVAGKKGALALGIAAAQYEVLLLTDADCTPLSTQWLFGMVSGLGNKDIGLAYAPYAIRDNFLNRFIRFETVWTATQYLGLALAGAPYMGVGRNLIYKKSVYEKVGGFTNHINIASGDDDLFIKSVINKKNFAIILNPETFMVSEPKTQWIGYFTQKKRHFTTASSYKPLIKLHLGMLSASHFFYFVTAVLLLALKFSTIFVLTICVTRTCIIWVSYGKILRKFSEKSLLPWIPFLDAAYVLFYIVFAPALARKSQKWQ